jgi:hypothetical protein
LRLQGQLAHRVQQDQQVPQAQQVLQAPLAQPAPPQRLLSEQSRRVRLLPSQTAGHLRLPYSTSYSPKATRVILATLAPQVQQELQDQPPRLRSALQLQELRPLSPTLALRPPLSLTLFSCQEQLDQQDQLAQQALLALQPRLQLAPSRKALPLQ